MDVASTPREHGLRIGQLEPGPANSIADVAGIGVGHVTVVRDEPDPPAGRGAARTGVTAVVHESPERMYAAPLAAGVAVLNGAGELTGSHELRELGVLRTPVYLCSTMAVGRVYDGAVSVALAANPEVGVDEVVIPVVGECDDSWLNDARDVQVEAADAARAVADAASAAAVAQGCVGAGAGMVCFDWKGGIGSSSRVAGDHVVGVLVLANFGSAEQLRVDGVPLGRLLGAAKAAGAGPPETGAAAPGARPGPPDPGAAAPAAGAGPPEPAGSCIAVVATDAPLGPAQLERVARRAGLGLARTGSVAHHGSGEIFVAFSTGARAAGDAALPATLPDSRLNPLFAATVEAAEEAVLGALWHAETTTGREGRVVPALPREQVLDLLRRAGRL